MSEVAASEGDGGSRRAEVRFFYFIRYCILIKLCVNEGIGWDVKKILSGAKKIVERGGLKLVSAAGSRAPQRRWMWLDFVGFFCQLNFLSRS